MTKRTRAETSHPHGENKRHAPEHDVDTAYFASVDVTVPTSETSQFQYTRVIPTISQIQSITQEARIPIRPVRTQVNTSRPSSSVPTTEPRFASISKHQPNPSDIPQFQLSAQNAVLGKVQEQDEKNTIVQRHIENLPSFEESDNNDNDNNSGSVFGEDGE